MDEFFVVWKENGGPPTKQYARQYDAQVEAARLARTVGGRFYVLRAICSAVRTDIQWEMAPGVVDESDIPF